MVRFFTMVDFFFLTMEDNFPFHGEDFFLPWKIFSFHGEFFSYHGRFFSYHGGYSEPEAVLVMERMAREASQSESGTVYRATTPQVIFAIPWGGYKLTKSFC